MILAWQLGRAVAWLKRISTAADRIAAAVEEQSAIARDQHPLRRPPRQTEFTVASVAEWNERWRTEHPELSPAAAAEEPPPDAS